MKLTETEKKFIIKNYPTLGAKKCAEELKINLNSIFWFASKNNIKFSAEARAKNATNNIKTYWKNNPKTIDSYSINTRLFVEDFIIESAYILGLIWADGNLNGSSNHYTINIECVTDDMNYFKQILDKTGKWNYYNRQREDYRPVTTAQISNKYLFEFLKENDFCEKSLKSPDKIVSKFKDDPKLIKAFLIGMIDGDGCFYYGENAENNNKTRQFAIAGTYKQDWSFIKNTFKELNIKYTVKRSSQKMILRGKNIISKSSVVRITNREDIKKLGEFIFSEETKEMGLPRKKEKYEKIIQLPISEQLFNHKHYEKFILDYLGKYKSCTYRDLKNLIFKELSDVLSQSQKKARIGNLMQAMKISGKICNVGQTWKLCDVKF